MLDKEYACAGRRLQNLVDAVVKRSKLSYAEAYASLEVPVVPPPAQVPQSSADVPPSRRAVNTGISSEQTSPRVRTPCLYHSWFRGFAAILQEGNSRAGPTCEGVTQGLCHSLLVGLRCGSCIYTYIGPLTWVLAPSLKTCICAGKGHGAGYAAEEAGCIRQV